MFDCLPQAFTKSQRCYAYIDTLNGFLYIDSSSTGKAEELMKMLRESLGSLPVVPIQTTESPAVVMTAWLRDAVLPEGLEIGQECELRDPREDGAIIRCKNQDLLSEEVERHINAGKQSVKLAISWDDTLQCMLNDDLSIKRLKFGETLIQESLDSSDGDKAAEFDADFALMTLALRRFTQALLQFFGDARTDSQ